jgi:hypothetical protein
VDLLVLGDALEVHVLHLRLDRMHVEGAQQHLLGRALELERQDRGVELLVDELLVQLAMVELDVHGAPVAAVHDARHPARAAQAAARTRTFHLAGIGVDLEFH